MCVAYLRQKSRVNFRSTKVDAGKLKRKYLNRPWSTLAVKVLRAPQLVKKIPAFYGTQRLFAMFTRACQLSQS
jgi:hypothetical protein